MKPTAPSPQQSLYKLNFSTLLNQSHSKAHPPLFNVNLCLTSPSLDTSNKVFAMYVLSQSITKHSLPPSQVYYLIYKCLIYLTTQNAVEPTLLMNCFFTGSFHIEPNDISFEFYLKRLVAVLAKKHKVTLKEALQAKINDCEFQLDSYIKQFNMRLRSNNMLFSEMSLIKNVIETSLTMNVSDNDNDNKDYYYYVMSVNALQTALQFVIECLNYEHKSKEEFDVFIKNAFDYYGVKAAFYKDKYSYNIYTKQKKGDNDDNNILFPLFLDNTHLITYKNSLSSDNEEQKENVFLKKDITLNKDYVLLNQEQVDTIEKVFMIKTKILRKKTEVHYKDIKCFILNDDERFYRKFHIQISHHKTLKQFKHKVLECLNIATQPDNTTENTNNTYTVIDLYAVHKDNSEILNHIVILNKHIETTFFTHAVNHLLYDDNTPMNDITITDDSIILIDIYTTSTSPHVQYIQTNKCTSCNNDITNVYECDICNYGLYCSVECANSNKKHSQLHKLLSYFYSKTTSLEDISSSLSLEQFNTAHGLYNLNNTCFMNSSIQCLFNTDNLTKYFLMNLHSKDINLSNRLGTKGELASKYSDLITTMLHQPNDEPVNPISFARCIYQRISAFRPGEQNDAHEFISIFLDNLHEDLNRISNKPYTELTEQKANETDEEASERFWKCHKQREDSIIVDLFYGQYKSTITCPDCGNKNTTYDPFSSIGLSVPDKVGLLQMKYIEMSDDDVQQPSIYEYTTSVFPNTVVKALKDHVRNEIGKYDVEIEAVVLNKKKMVCDVVSDDVKVYAYVKNGFEIYMYNKSHIKSGNSSNNSNNVVFVYPMQFNKAQWSFSNKKKKTFIAYPLMLSVDTSSSHLISNLMHTLSKIYDNTIQIRSLYLFANKRYDFTTHKDKPIEIPNNNNNNANNSKYCLLNDNNQTELITKLNNPYHHPVVIFAELTFLITNNNNTTTTTNKYPHVDQRYIPNKRTTDFFRLNPSSLTIQNAFDFFQCEEKLEANNTWYCNKCKKHQEAYKKLDIYKPSKYLIIQFKRFQIKSNNMFMSLFTNKKISTYINYDVTNLDLRKYVIGPERSTAVYDLYGVVEHMGSLRYGHYTALCKTAQGNWLRFNDETCSIIDTCVVKDAYLLFYKMKSNN